jgi:hypothetical protein
MVEYSENNRFPFHTGNKSVSIYMEDHEDMHQLDFIFSKILDKFPSLDPKLFYGRVAEIQQMRERDRLKYLKEETDKLFKSIKSFLMDEDFIHLFHDKWDIGIDKIIETLYSVYGYYFYTGKRSANAIKKIIDGYARKPVH